MKRAVLVVAMVLARSALADETVSVETHGVEIQVPKGWSTVEKGATATLSPKAYKGRAIEVVALPSMPADEHQLQKLLDPAKITVVKSKAADRQGVRMIVGAGTLEGKDKAQLDVDLVILPVAKGATLVMSFIRSDQDPILKHANEAILLSAQVAGPKITVEVTPTKTKGLGAPQDFIDRFRTGVAPKLDALLRFPRPLPIRFQDCSQVNAFYSADAHDIKICHELFDGLRAMFKGAGIDDKRVEEITLNTVVFAFFHEFGHAVVGEFGLPITGKGEDAADELAILVLVGQGKNGQKIALDAADWFDMMGKQGANRVTARTFFDEHSYDEARVGNILCMLYGADKVTYGDLMKKRGMPARRLAFCLKDYPDRRKTWEKLLAPYQRKVAKP